MARVDLYQQVTDRVVAELEKGVAPWVRPWRTPSETGGLPHNGYTKRSYRGVNVWVLAMSAASRGFDDPRWFTFRQASLLGAHIKKGEKSTLIAFWRIRPVAGALLIPYLAWVSFATALTWLIWQRNPQWLG